MNDNAPVGPDTMTLPLNKTKALFGTIAGIGTSMAVIGGLIWGGVSYGVDQRFDKKLKEAVENPKSNLNLAVEKLVEEELGEFIETVVDDDFEYIDRRLEMMDGRIERLEGN